VTHIHGWREVPHPICICELQANKELLAEFVCAVGEDLSMTLSETNLVCTTSEEPSVMSPPWAFDV
jgi:hypothetical protein